MQDSDSSMLRNLTDTARIIQVFNKYFRALDEKNFAESHLQTLFTPEARIVRPHGQFLVGPKEIGESQEKSFARFRNTQHILTGHDVEINGNTAAIRANLVAIHVWKDSSPAERDLLKSSFIAGGVITGKFLRSADGWRISAMENYVVWRAGSGFENILATEKL